MNWKEKLQKLGITPLNTVDFAPLNMAEIERIETHLGVKLPDDFRLFLSTYGEADFEEFIYFPTNGGPVYPGNFYGENLLKTIQENEERLPSLVIAFNNDGGDNLFCISVRKHDFGHIYFQNHSFLGSLTFISGNFTNFIFGLTIDETP
jgi:SMI1-KNR4 cell-wall